MRICGWLKGTIAWQIPMQWCKQPSNKSRGKPTFKLTVSMSFFGYIYISCLINFISLYQLETLCVQYQLEGCYPKHTNNIGSLRCSHTTRLLDNITSVISHLIVLTQTMTSKAGKINLVKAIIINIFGKKAIFCCWSTKKKKTTNGWIEWYVK